jgi:hypothetical protein
VKTALLEHPAVLAAQAGVRAGVAGRERLVAGMHETSIRFGAQQRKERSDPGQRYNEWDVGLERALRLPGKAEMDRRLGDAGLAQAHTAHGDALHESGRALLKAWFAWGRENAAARQWREQVAALKAQLAIVGNGRAGDAPSWKPGWPRRRWRRRKRCTRWPRSRWQPNGLPSVAGIAPPASLPLSLPAALERGLDYWREEILKHNHELAVARNEAKIARMERNARRSVPRLSFGAPLPSGAAERIVGQHAFPSPARHGACAETLASPMPLRNAKRRHCARPA